jgi:hypothetical protein
MWQQAAQSPYVPPDELVGVIDLVEELVELFGGVPIDCEFAVTELEEVEVLWLLQARRLLLSRKSERVEEQTARLKRVEDKVALGMRAHPFLRGRRTAYGVMPDWNPAEIIGVRPRPLALSLYRELVTDSVWAYQRHNYGYRNLRSFPLMLHFYGLPYIDVRVSFNSFIPAELDDVLAGRLVDYYVDRLLAEPALHDKVEFEIVFSCYTLDLPKRLGRLEEEGFSNRERNEIQERLRDLTNAIIHPNDGLWRSDERRIATLTDRREKLLSSTSDSLDLVYWLLEDCKRYGTLPFAGLARAGFIAVQMLRSFVEVGVFTQSDYESFLRSVSTVGKQLAMDRVALDRSTFLGRYGHLRPGTYDILSLRYDEAPELYFDWGLEPSAKSSEEPFSCSLSQMRELAKLLQLHGLHSDAIEVLSFLQAGIELRELAKFHFSRNISDALSLISEIGARLGFSRDDMSFCDVSTLVELHKGVCDAKSLLSRSIEHGKVLYYETQRICLPPLISRPQDVWGFRWPVATPNFITQREVTGDVAGVEDRERLAGSIVCIPNADPGFDWLFAYPLGGLVTAWGGANSHMAIRAGELGIPAVIGAGERQYRLWSSARRLRLDCAGRRVEILA